MPSTMQKTHLDTHIFIYLSWSISSNKVFKNIKSDWGDDYKKYEFNSDLVENMLQFHNKQIIVKKYNRFQKKYKTLKLNNNIGNRSIKMCIKEFKLSYF